MTPNVPLLLKVLEHITAHPEEHDQNVWGRRATGACGTVGCLAYHAVVISGLGVRWDGSEAEFVADVADGRSIAEVATELLSLRDDQAHEMFHHADTLRQLWWMAAEYTRGEITPPPEFA